MRNLCMNPKSLNGILKKSLPFAAVPFVAVVVLYAPVVCPPSEGTSHSRLSSQRERKKTNTFKLKTLINIFFSFEKVELPLFHYFYLVDLNRNCNYIITALPLGSSMANVSLFCRYLCYSTTYCSDGTRSNF